MKARGYCVLKERPFNKTLPIKALRYGAVENIF